MELLDPKFIISAHSLKQLPESECAEIAFAGRSNVGKSSLLNALLNRKGLVKVSGRPGKTQGLNFFLVSGTIHLVDLPGYGFARVSKTMQAGWGSLISAYLETRRQLCGVVVIMDIRHEAKKQDSELLLWLRQRNISCLTVYTKADKLSGNERTRQAQILDAGHGVDASNRVIFSAKNGMGRELLLAKLAALVEGRHA